MTAISQTRMRLETALRIGPLNVARVLIYRMALSVGIHPVQRQQAVLPSGPFFSGSRRDAFSRDMEEVKAPSRISWFGWIEYPLDGDPPDWHRNIVSGVRFPDPMRSWWQLPDFIDQFGDIKCIWEPSRLDWTLGFAQRHRAGNDHSLVQLNTWLADWCKVNPAYLGPNWKCGQEASIRVMHLLMAACILEEDVAITPALGDLLDAHLKRIAPTISYAVGQDNNHGTSEAAALFMGATVPRPEVRATDARWALLGRKRLEERVARLILPDGSFSQYSVNYHRLLLDTLSMVEIWRRRRQLSPFSTRFYRRAHAASEWLRSLVHPDHGDAPNLGANDGARLLPIASTDCRDYRPSVEMACALFAERDAYPRHTESHQAMRWLGIKIPAAIAPEPHSSQCDDGGHTIMRTCDWFVLMRYPRYRFRPRHCDALHLDIWKGGVNVARDGGSYSYNAPRTWRNYFSGTIAHNTIQFDGRDQMPEIGRFLRGAWLRCRDVHPLRIEQDTCVFAAGYIDRAGGCHHRHVRVSPARIVVTDQVRGFTERAILRWRLKPGIWRIEGTNAIGEDVIVSVSSNVPVKRLELVEGWESRYYQQVTSLPVLEVEIARSGTLVTKLTNN